MFAVTSETPARFLFFLDPLLPRGPRAAQLFVGREAGDGDSLSSDGDFSVPRGHPHTCQRVPRAWRSE